MWHFPLCSRQGWASYLLWHFWMGNFPSLNFHLSHNTFVSFYIGTYYDAQNVRLVKWHGMKTCQPTNVLFESWKIHSLPICYLLETFLTVYAFLWLPASCALYVKVHYISTLRVFDILTLPLAPTVDNYRPNISCLRRCLSFLSGYFLLHGATFVRAKVCYLVQSTIKAASLHAQSWPTFWPLRWKPIGSLPEHIY